MSKTYIDQLRDPRWQRKRLEILQRDEFMCCICQDTDKELHVHHLAYRKGLMPWEYRDYEYCTMCESCHMDAERLIKEVRYCTGFGPTTSIIRSALELISYRSWESFGRLISAAEFCVPDGYSSDHYQI